MYCSGVTTGFYVTEITFTKWNTYFKVGYFYQAKARFSRYIAGKREYFIHEFYKAYLQRSKGILDCDGMLSNYWFWHKAPKLADTKSQRALDYDMTLTSNCQRKQQ